MKPVLTVFLFLSYLFYGFSQESKFTVSTPPAELGLDKFYKKYTDAGGIPILSSWRVSDEAIIKVANRFCIISLPDIFRKLSLNCRATAKNSD